MTLNTLLQSFPSLLPANIELGFALTFAEDQKVFITKTGCRPHLKILSADLDGLCVILEQSSLIQIHQKLASSSMQFSFKRTTSKTFSVETGWDKPTDWPTYRPANRPNQPTEQKKPTVKHNRNWPNQSTNCTKHYSVTFAFAFLLTFAFAFAFAFV